MKVTLPGKIEPLNLDLVRQGTESQISSGKTFSEVLRECKSAGCVNEISGATIQAELQKFKDMVAKGRPLSFRDLLYYQIRANELNMRVELISKCADGFLSLTRKLQQGQ